LGTEYQGLIIIIIIIIIQDLYSATESELDTEALKITVAKFDFTSCIVSVDAGRSHQQLNPATSREHWQELAERPGQIAACGCLPTVIFNEIRWREVSRVRQHVGDNDSPRIHVTRHWRRLSVFSGFYAHLLGFHA